MKKAVQVMIENELFLCNTKNIEGITSGSTGANKFLHKYIRTIDSMYDIKRGDYISKDFADLALVSEINYEYFEEFKHDKYEEEVVIKTITLRVHTYDQMKELTTELSKEEILSQMV